MAKGDFKYFIQTGVGGELLHCNAGLQCQNLEGTS